MITWFVNNFVGILGVSLTIIGIFLTIDFTMNKIQGAKVVQSADEMQDVTGADVKLTDGEDISIRDLDILQAAGRMRNVKGLSIEASGDRSGKLEGIHLKQQWTGSTSEVIISDDPNIDVRVNVRK